MGLSDQELMMTDGVRYWNIQHRGSLPARDRIIRSYWGCHFIIEFAPTTEQHTQWLTRTVPSACFVGSHEEP